MPRWASNSWCEPCSRSLPLWKTRMRSACWMVLNRWAITNAVRPASSRSRASRISNSVFVSTLDVASSRIKKRGLCARARAKLISCRWPTENVAPRSVTGTVTPPASDWTNPPRLHAEGHVAQHPILVGGIVAAAIGEPDVAEFNLAARLPQRKRLGGRGDRHRLVEQLEDALGAGHRRLQHIELLAEILNGPEEPLRVLHESDQDADLDAARQHPQAAEPEQ